MAIKHRKRLGEGIIVNEPKTLDKEVIHESVESSSCEFNQEIEAVKEDMDEKVEQNEYETKNYCSDGQYLYDKLRSLKVGRHIWAKENHYNIDDKTEKILLEFRTVRKMETELLDRHYSSF